MATNIIWVAKTGRAGAAGTESAPLASIQEAVNKATPGTTIMVKEGVYNENVIIRNAATASAPIVIKSADGEGKAEVRSGDSNGTFSIKAAHYITIDGFKVVNTGYGNGIHVSSQENMTKIPGHITIQNNDIRPSAGDGVKVSQGDYVTIKNNTVVGSTQEQGIDVVGGAHTVITQNDVSGVTGGAAIQVKGGSYDVEVSHNYVHDTGRWGINIGGSTNLQNIRPDAAGQNFEVKDVRVFGNETDGTKQQALRVMGAQDAKIYDNWFHDVSSSRFIDIVGSGDTHPIWSNKNISFSNNSVDRPQWLVVEGGQPQPTVSNMITNGSAPANWKGQGSVSSSPDTSTGQTPVDDSAPDANVETPASTDADNSPVDTAPIGTGTPAPVPSKTAAAHDDTATTTAGRPVKIAILANDDPFAWKSAKITDPGHGDLSGGGNNTLIYTPDRGFKGTDTFKYTLSDGAGHQSTATVTVTVTDATASKAPYYQSAWDFGHH